MSKNDWQNVNEILGKLSVCALTKLFASVIHNFQSHSIFSSKLIVTWIIKHIQY